MKSQPKPDYDSNDVVMTPRHLAKRIVNHFKPFGKVLEPCAGGGSFVDALQEYSGGHEPHGIDIDWCEITQGRNFFNCAAPANWIITNPPWSQIRPFLQHGMKLADNIVFLMTVNHVWTKARIRDIGQTGFGIKEICLVEMPKDFPQSGFQLGAIHIARGWKGDIKMSDISNPK